jgi:hypothetical protein
MWCMGYLMGDSHGYHGHSSVVYSALLLMLLRPLHA